jgi:inorganic pyrophosphatase
MALKNVTAGINAPEEFNVIIEIPAMSDPIKYEVDKETGALFVDRFMMTAMHYPCNYGYVPETIADDGDPVDVLVITPFPVSGGSVVRCRPLGVLKMDDEAGATLSYWRCPPTRFCQSTSIGKRLKTLTPIASPRFNISLSTTKI